MFLFGSGGHSAEMLMLLKNAGLEAKVETNKLNKIVCVISEDDELIKSKLAQVIGDFDSVLLKRARRVGQSYVSSVFTTILSLLNAFSLVTKHKPKVCLTNGPAIGLMVCLAIRILQIVTFGIAYRCEILYIESFCRTKTLSLTGRIIYYSRISSQFLVQWPKLKELYPRSRYLGLLV